MASPSGGASGSAPIAASDVFPVAGVFVDYGSDQGVVMVSRRTYDAYWDDRGVSSLGVVVAPGADVSAMIEILRARAGAEQDLLIRSNRALREASLEIFDRTFAITAVLRVLATAIAVIGVLSALMALQLERARELGVLRAQGLTPREVWRLTLAETGLLGAIAGVLAVPVGIGLALVLIHVINRRAFGWSIEAVIPMDVLLQAVGLAVAGRARRGRLSRLADGADAARARSQGGVTSVRRRTPGSDCSSAWWRSVTVIAAGLGLVIRLDGGRSSRARARGDTLARGGARDGGRPRGSSGRSCRGPSSFPRTTVPTRRSAPSGGTGPGTSARRGARALAASGSS